MRLLSILLFILIGSFFFLEVPFPSLCLSSLALNIWVVVRLGLDFDSEVEELFGNLPMLEFWARVISMPDLPLHARNFSLCLSNSGIAAACWFLWRAVNVIKTKRKRGFDSNAVHSYHHCQAPENSHDLYLHLYNRHSLTVHIEELVQNWDFGSV